MAEEKKRIENEDEPVEDPLLYAASMYYGRVAEYPDHHIKRVLEGMTVAVKSASFEDVIIDDGVSGALVHDAKDVVLEWIKALWAIADAG